MPMYKAKGHMYDWVTHTWNTIKGECYHDCLYCYMKRWGKQNPIHFDERELQTDLGKGNVIFVGNSNDMFATQVHDEWIRQTLDHCSKFDNQYIFQSKNPDGIIRMQDYLPNNSVIGTTIETNRDIPSSLSKAPPCIDRTKWIAEWNGKKFITIEPIIDFDLIPMIALITLAEPTWINIGADSKNHNLPEPSREKTLSLIDAIKELGVEVRQKTNLNRLLTLSTQKEK